MYYIKEREKITYRILKLKLFEILALFKNENFNTKNFRKFSFKIYL